MAYYLDFTDSHVTIPQWSASGDFAVSFRTVYISNNELTLGRSGTLDGWVGTVSGTFKIRIGSSVTDTGISISNGQDCTVVITRTGNNVSVDVNGSVFNFTSSATLIFNKIGGNSALSYADSVEDLYYLNLDNGTDIRAYTPNTSKNTGMLIDTVGGNHGTLQNFTLPDAYVYYYDWLNESADDALYDNCLKLTTATESISLPLVGAYDINLTLEDDSVENFVGTDTFTLDGTTPRAIKFISGTDSNGNVFYDFNNSPETAPNVPELIQGLNGTMVGFPEPSGYVIGEDGRYEGYRLSDSSQSISFPLVGSWVGTITYVNGSTLAVNGTDTYVIDGTAPVEVASFDVDDSNGNHYYDFTTGDADQIIDTVGGNHATIVNTPTSGYLPVVERQVFTGNDYTDIQAFVGGESASNYLSSYVNGKGKPQLEGFTAVITWDNLPSDFTATVKADGEDFIIATDPLGNNRLPVEKVSYDSATSQFVTWVRMPRYGGVDRTLWLLYGDATFVQPAVDALYGRNAVWVDYEFVFHLTEQPNNSVGGYINAAGGNDGTATAITAVSNITSPFGNDVFNADNTMYIQADLTSPDGSDYTLQAWGRPESLSQDQRLIGMGNGNNAVNHCLIWMDNASQDTWAAIASNTSPITGGVPVVNAWQMLHHVNDNGGSQVLYADGTSIASGTGQPLSSVVDTFRVGANAFEESPSGNADNFDGGIAEARLRFDALSSDFISTEYANQSNPATFWNTSQSEPATGTNFTRRCKLVGQPTTVTVPDFDMANTSNQPVIIDNVTGVNEKLVFSSANDVHIKNSVIDDVDATLATGTIAIENSEVGDVTG